MKRFVIRDLDTKEEWLVAKNMEVCRFIGERIGKRITPCQVSASVKKGYFIANRYIVYPEGGKPVEKAKMGRKRKKGEIDGIRYERYHPDVIIATAVVHKSPEEIERLLNRRDKDFMAAVVMGDNPKKKDPTRWKLEFYYLVRGKTYEEQVEEMKKRLKNLQIS